MKKLLLLVLALLTMGASSQLFFEMDKLSDTPKIMIPTATVRRVTWCILEGGASDAVVIFRAVGGTPEYSRVNVAAGVNVSVKLGQNVNGNNGLELATVTAAGDVRVSCAVKLQ